MKIYVVPSAAYKQPGVFDTLSINLMASVVTAMNKEEALGRIMLDMKNKYPEEDGWLHLIGDIDDDSTEEIIELIDKL